MREILFGIFASLVVLFLLACQSSELTSAKMYLKEGNIESAEEWLLKAMALEVEADNAEIPFLLAKHIYATQKRYPEMIKMLDEAMLRNADQDINGNSVRELVLNVRQVEWESNYRRGVEIYNRVVTESQGGALSDAQRTDIEEGIEIFKTTIMIWPEEGTSYPNLVLCYRQLGDKANAAAALQTALDRDLKNATVQMLAGEAQAEADNLEGALGFYESAYAIAPDNMVIMQRLTSAYLEGGNLPSALNILEETQKLAPNDPNISFNIGAVYENIGNDALKQGQDLYRDAVQAAELLTSDIEEALEHFKQAQNAYSEALYFLDNALALNLDDMAADQALVTIRKRKKILDTIQRAAEDILRDSK